MERFSRFILTGLLLLCGTSAFAGEAVEMADQFRADGKIYVVVAIILVVLLGFIAYLFLLDKRMGKIEKQVGLKK